MELVLLTQPNCTGCKTLKRKLKSEDVAYTEVDITVEAGTIKKHGIQSAPVLILLEDGEEVARITGYEPELQEEDVDEFIDQLG